jgi:hypothetical protein
VDAAVTGPLTQIDAQAWHEALTTNLTSVFYGMEAKILTLTRARIDRQQRRHR